MNTQSRPPDFHPHDNLFSKLHQSNSQPEEKYSPLLQNIESDKTSLLALKTLESKRRCKFLQIIMSIMIRLLVILGQRSIWIFGLLMYTFRSTDRNRYLFFAMILLSQLALRYSLFPRGVALGTCYVCIMVVAALFAISPIHQWITGKNYSDTKLFNNNDKSNEALKELNEKRNLLKYFSKRIGEITERQENIPRDLSLAIQLALAEVDRLTSELDVASELSEAESGLIQAEINNIPKEKFFMNKIENDSSDMCSICIESFKHKQEVRKLPCGHRLHMKCADDWMNKLAACPNCKASLENYKNNDLRNSSEVKKQTNLNSKIFAVKDTLISNLRNLLVWILHKKYSFNNKKLV